MQLLSFIGRTKEVNDLKLALDLNSLIMITGKPGVGKSSLLTHTLKQVAYKRTIHIHCEISLSLEQLLFKIAESLSIFEGFDYAKFASNPNLDDLFETIEELKIIVIIDDFQNLVVERCIDFLSLVQRQLHQSKAILISTCLPNISEFELIKVANIQVNLLDPDESTSLVHHLMVRDRNDVNIIPNEIYHKLNGHPVFINHFVSLIVFGSHTIDNLLIQDSALDQFIIEYVKTKIWDRLNQHQKNILKIFNRLRLPISLEQFIEISPDLIEEDIKELIRAFLIEKSPTGELYSDSLFKDFSEISLLNSKNELHFQIAQSYKNKEIYSVQDLRESCYHYFKGKYFDDFAEMVLKGVEFLSLSSTNNNQMLKVSDYLNDCTKRNYQILLKAHIIELVLAFNFKEARALLIEIDDQSEKEFLSCLICSEQIDPQSSKFIITTLESYLNEKSDIEEFSLINIYLLKTFSHLKLNQEGLAKQSIEKLLQITKKSPFIFALIYYRLSLIYIANDSYISSTYLEQCLNLLSKNYPNCELYAKALVAKASIQLGYYCNYEEALKNIQQSKLIYKKFKKTNSYIFTLIFEVSISLKRDDTKQALKILSELDKIDDLSYHDNLGVLMLKGTAYLLEKDMNKAKFYYEKMYSQMDSERGFGRPNYLAYFRYLILSNQPKKALKFSQEPEFLNWDRRSPIDEAIKLFYTIKVYEEFKNTLIVEELTNQYQLIVSKLPKFSKIKLKHRMEWNQKCFIERFSEKITIITNQSVKQVSKDQAYKLIADTSNWDIVLNFCSDKIYVSNQEIDLSSKGKLLLILKELIAFRDSSISSYDLYEKCWGMKFNPKVDGALKTNISRLRKMLANHIDQAIIITPKKGHYALNPLINFCCLTIV
ncbi:NB-ARC domain-containing protein [bacterium]|nr:NB-ARC domain-containing protein [bacterium]